MRRFALLLLPMVLLGLPGCQPATPDSAAAESGAPKAAGAAPDSASGRPAKATSVFDLPTLRTAYVTRPEGQTYYEQPSPVSLALGELSYGQAVEIIGYRDQADGRWAELKERTERNSTRDGHAVTTWAWEKVYVPESSLDELVKVQLRGPELLADARVTFADTTRHSPLADSLTLQLLPAAAWPAAARPTVVRRPGVVLQQGRGRLKLRIGQAPGYVTLRDKKPSDELDEETYEYLGEVDSLNAYVVGVTYYEDWGYRLIDRTTGRPREELSAPPQLAPDGRHLLCVGANPYLEATQVELYRVSGGRLRLVLRAEFPHWVPADEPATLRWLGPRQAVIRAGHPITYGLDARKLDPRQFQVLQLTIR